MTPRRPGRQRPSSRRAIASAFTVPSKLASRPVHSLHDAALTLLDGAVDVLKSGQDDEAVHAARKACKRLRAGLRLLRDCVGADVYRRENAAVRDASKPLAAVRDAFALRGTLRAADRRSAALERGLNSDYRAARRALESRGAERTLAQLMATRERLLDLPADAAEGASAVAGVGRVYRAGRKAFRRAGRRDDAALHEWRKQAKYLLNQLELLKTVFHVSFKKLARRADELAEVLGDDHDLSVLIRKLPADEDRSLAKHLKMRRRKLQARAFRLGKKLYRRPARRLQAAVAARLPQFPATTRKASPGEPLPYGSRPAT